MAYQIYCENHDYGRSFMIFDEVRHDKDQHIAENPGCAYAVEIHESLDGGGFRRLEAGDGTQLPDEPDETY